MAVETAVILDQSPWRHYWLGPLMELQRLRLWWLVGVWRCCWYSPWNLSLFWWLQKWVEDFERFARVELQLEGELGIVVLGG